jgi:hypothetical protein
VSAFKGAVLLRCGRREYAEDTDLYKIMTMARPDKAEKKNTCTDCTKYMDHAELPMLNFIVENAVYQPRILAAFLAHQNFSHLWGYAG